MAEYTYKQWGSEQTPENAIHADDCYRWQAGIEAAGGTWDGEWVDLDTSGVGTITADQLNALETEIASLYGTGFTAKTWEDGQVPGVDEWNRIEDALNTILNRTAFAIYCETDNSLTFYVDYPVPSAGETYNGKTVTNVYTGFTTSTWSSASGQAWASQRNNITTVDFNSSFKMAQPISLAYWFSAFPSLTKLTNCGNIDTSQVTTIYGVFYQATALTSLDLSSWDVSSVTNMQSAFRETALTSLDLNSWDVSSVTNMGYMFYSNSALVSIDLSGWDTSSVTNMQYLFASNSALVSIDLSGWDTSSVTNMGYMFYSNSALVSIDLSGWDTSSVTNMERMFMNCRSIVSLDIGDWDTSKVTTFVQTFNGCTALASIDISKWNTSSLTLMNYIFASCTSLETLDLSGFDTGNVENMNYAFSGNTSLVTIYAGEGQFNTDKVTTDTNMFNSCSKLVGGNGTTYSSSKIDSSMAHIDTEDNPGYFTKKE